MPRTLRFRASRVAVTRLSTSLAVIASVALLASASSGCKRSEKPGAAVAGGDADAAATDAGAAAPSGRVDTVNDASLDASFDAATGSDGGPSSAHVYVPPPPGVAASASLELPARGVPDKAPALVALTPVRHASGAASDKPGARLPNLFDPEGRLLLRCDDGVCRVRDRVSGGYRGTVPESEVASFRKSSASMSAKSPNGKYVLKRHGDRGVAMLRVEGGAVLAHADHAEETCAVTGAWKGDEARVAVPCGHRMLALSGTPAKAEWSAKLAEDAKLRERGVWGDAIVAAGDAPEASRSVDGNESGENLFAWRPGQDEGAFRPSDGASHQVTFDPVRGCVFQYSEFCGCDCHESEDVTNCDPAYGSIPYEGPDARTHSTGKAAPSVSADGTLMAWLLDDGHDHEVAFYGVEVVRLTATGAVVHPSGETTVASESDAPRRALPLSRFNVVVAHELRRGNGIGYDHALVVGRLDGAWPTRVVVGSSDVIADEETDLFPSDDESLVLHTGRTGAAVVSIPEAKVLSTWRGVTEARFAPGGHLIAGELDGVVEVRAPDAKLVWASAPRVAGTAPSASAGPAPLASSWTPPAPAPSSSRPVRPATAPSASASASAAGRRLPPPPPGNAKLVGWLADPAKKNVLAVTIAGVPHEITVTTGARVPRKEFAPAEIAPRRAAPAPPAFRATSLHGLERASDGARMLAGDDRVFPQGEAAREAWHDLDEGTHFLLGNDVLRSPLVARAQLDPTFVVPGAFETFMKGEPLPAAPEPVAPPPPVLSVDVLAAEVFADAGSSASPRRLSVKVAPASPPVAYFEIEYRGHVERLAVEDAPRSLARAFEPDAVARVRACGAATCSPWTALNRAPRIVW